MKSMTGPRVDVRAAQHLPQVPLALRLVSMSVLVNFSAPSGKWPQKITALVQMLRMTLAVKFA